MSCPYPPHAFLQFGQNAVPWGSNSRTRVLSSSVRLKWIAKKSAGNSSSTNSGPQQLKPRPRRQSILQVQYSAPPFLRRYASYDIRGDGRLNIMNNCKSRTFNDMHTLTLQPIPW